MGGAHHSEMHKYEQGKICPQFFYMGCSDVNRTFWQKILFGCHFEGAPDERVFLVTGASCTNIVLVTTCT